MTHDIPIGGLSLSFEMLSYAFPSDRKLRDPVLVNARVTTPFSQASAERLGLPFGELVAFRNRLKKFLRREDEGVVSLSVLMPFLDVTFIARTGDRVMADVRLSPDLRLERHMYDFELTWKEVGEIVEMFDVLLVSLPLHQND